MVAAVIAAKRPNPVPTQEVAVQYLCLIYSDESQWPKLPKDEHDRIVGEYLGYMEDIRRSGHYLGCNRLQPTGAATTVRVRGGKLTTTDGPFAETKEHLLGIYLIDVPDLDTALDWADRMPFVGWGTVEVRPVLEGLPFRAIAEE
jgi:hypothetical protein